MRTEGELRALVSLLADEQEQVARVAWDALVMAGEEAIPYLEANFDASEPLLRGRARMLIEELRFQAVEARWSEYLQQPDESLRLEEGCLLIAAIPGEEVKERAIASFLDVIAGTVRAQLPRIGGLRALSEVLFENLGFRGGEFEIADHHYLPTVLERRRGLPILLAVLYVLVGQRVGLPVYGVAMPNHFLALYVEADQPAYVDCFNRGQIYRQETLQSLLKKRGVASPSRALLPCSTRQMLYRMLNNLDQVYTDGQHERLAERVRRWRGQIRLGEG